MARHRKVQSPDRFKVSLDLPPVEYKELLNLRNTVEKQFLKSGDEWHMPITLAIVIRTALTMLASSDLDQVLTAIRELQRRSLTKANRKKAPGRPLS